MNGMIEWNEWKESKNRNEQWKQLQWGYESYEPPFEPLSPLIRNTPTQAGVLNQGNPDKPRGPYQSDVECL